MGQPEGFSVLTQLTFTVSLVAAKQGKRQSYEFLKCLIVWYVLLSPQQSKSYDQARGIGPLDF